MTRPRASASASASRARISPVICAPRRSPVSPCVPRKTCRTGCDSRSWHASRARNAQIPACGPSRRNGVAPRARIGQIRILALQGTVRFLRPAQGRGPRGGRSSAGAAPGLPCTARARGGAGRGPVCGPAAGRGAWRGPPVVLGLRRSCGGSRRSGRRRCRCRGRSRGCSRIRSCRRTALCGAGVAGGRRRMPGSRARSSRAGWRCGFAWRCLNRSCLCAVARRWCAIPPCGRSSRPGSGGRSGGGLSARRGSGVAVRSDRRRWRESHLSMCEAYPRFALPSTVVAANARGPAQRDGT
jgi:hypothetical protein